MFDRDCSKSDFRKSLPISMAKGIPEPTSELRERLPQNFFNKNLTDQRNIKDQKEVSHGTTALK